MPDILKGLAHLVQNSNFQLPSTRGIVGSRQVSLGKPFEVYCKDWLSLLPPGNVNNRQEYYHRAFCYQGADNNPPDVMYRGGNQGDAFEFKKTESLTAALPLNSSFPKNFLTRNSPGLLDSCINCEPWDKRSFYYIIGRIRQNDQRVSSLWVVDGELMASNHSTYASVFTGLQSAVDGFTRSQNLRQINSVELGRIRGIDSLDRTVLRVRSMWELDSPQRLFQHIEGVASSSVNSVLHALILESKWNNYSEESRNAIRQLSTVRGFSLRDVQNLPNPSNPDELLSAKLLRYEA